MEMIQYISIGLEAVIAIMCVLVAQRGRTYMYGLAATFAVYVFYDLARMVSWSIDPSVLSGIFFAATLTALYTVWSLYKQQ